MAMIGVGSMGTASAAGTAASGNVGALASPPSCVSSWTTTNYAYAKSACSGSYTIKFVWSFGRDSDCFTIHPGAQWSHKRPSSISGFDGLRLC
ncbi:hypothetical protein DVK44_19060 [Streptomyces paludis]|uniref:Uncharacterized protein n=1 Tax=Streptomyces paludis TaxID=2282738 RepID=A0A345HRS8_9ACTN|nr:hypothetical protein DVK44_19060 [Streptomyces paludis]